MTVLMTILVAAVLLGAFTLMYQVYQLIILDAESRGMKHPKFWGIFSLGGNDGGGGIILYLIGRKKYPSHMTDDIKEVFNSRKKKVILAWSCIMISTVGLICINLFGDI